MYANWKYAPLAGERRTLILDTDIGPDCDDAGALTLLLEYRRRLGFPVSGIVNCTSNPWGNGALRAIARFAGAELPIAQSEKAGLLEDAVKFDRPLCEKYLAEPDERTAARPAGKFYREALTQAADDSVVIVSIGQFTTLSALLDAEPELVRQKVHALVSMACAFPEGREFNVFMDAAAARNVFERFPCPIVCTGFEVGVDVLTGYEAPPVNAARNPVYDAYRLYLDSDAPLRPSWDLTAVHFAVEGEGAFYELSEAVSIQIGEDGGNATRPWDGVGAPRYYLRRRTDSGTLAGALNTLLHAADAW